MTTLDSDELTRLVLARFEATPAPRLRTIMQSLVRHLHAFARDVQLTDAEWSRGIEFATRTGQTCSDTRQEFILLSDVLGLSMQTVAINHDPPAGCTEPTVFGPFHVQGAPAIEHGGDIARGARGTACYVRGSVRGREGEPIARALIDVWQADAEGLYDVQRPELEHAQARGVLESRSDGTFAFRTVVAESYPIPTDGPVGELLAATRRSPWRPAHLHFKIQAAGYKTLITHIFRRGDPHLDADPVFGVRASLITEWVARPDGSALVEYDFVLEPVAATGAGR